ncbi:MAG TPA: hypothetical protein VKA46_36445 [Gemmataceae bacterium]|nr:hypothetical protein [Gemmataceae bacterium]
MPALTNLDARLDAQPAWRRSYDALLPDTRRVAALTPLVHVTGKTVPFEHFILTPPHELPTSHFPAYCSDLTRLAEEALGLPYCLYLYAGRAHPSFGSVALAFLPACEPGHLGTATPFDTGGLIHRYIRLALPVDDALSRVAFGEQSMVLLRDWREGFARFLAAYFAQPADYWLGRPNPGTPDPEAVHARNDDWRAWTFEIRFVEWQSIRDRAAWCADPAFMTTLRRLIQAQPLAAPGTPPTPLDLFLQGPDALAPSGAPNFTEVIEQWVRTQVGV